MPTTTAWSDTWGKWVHGRYLWVSLTRLKPWAEQGPLESRSLVERNRKNGSAVPGRGAVQGKSQEAGRAWEMAKEGRGGLPRALCCFMCWGQG